MITSCDFLHVQNILQTCHAVKRIVHRECRRGHTKMQSHTWPSLRKAYSWMRPPNCLAQAKHVNRAHMNFGILGCHRATSHSGVSQDGHVSSKGATGEATRRKQQMPA